MGRPRRDVNAPCWAAEMILCLYSTIYECEVVEELSVVSHDTLS